MPSETTRGINPDSGNSCNGFYRNCFQYSFGNFCRVLFRSSSGFWKKKIRNITKKFVIKKSKDFSSDFLRDSSTEIPSVIFSTDSSMNFVKNFFRKCAYCCFSVTELITSMGWECFQHRTLWKSKGNSSGIGVSSGSISYKICWSMFNVVCSSIVHPLICL